MIQFQSFNWPQVFHEVAYKARNRGDLMAGIDEFLDKVTVLPPGEWDPQIRLEPPSKVPSQANRKNAMEGAKLNEELVADPYKCKHCKSSMDHPQPIKWTKKCVHWLDPETQFGDNEGHGQNHCSP